MWKCKKCGSQIAVSTEIKDIDVDSEGWILQGFCYKKIWAECDCYCKEFTNNTKLRAYLKENAIWEEE